MFADQFMQFSSNLDALRDFVDLIEPILKSRKENMTEDQRLVISALLCGLQKLDPEKFSPAGISEKQKQKIDKTVKFSITEGDEKKRISINFDACDIGNPKLLDSTLKEVIRGADRSRLLFNSSLISLISAVEWFFSRLLHAYYEKYPQVAISADKVFSYEDLTRFSSVDDARRQIIERRVEEVLRGSFSDWIKYFRGNLKMSMSYLDGSSDDLVETFERRNLLVHNNGIINNIYLSKVNKKTDSDMKIGKSIKVNRRYLDNRISLFERCCLLVGAELWKQIAPSDKARGEVLINTTFAHMQCKRWDIAEGLSFFIMNDKKLPERDLMIGKMNYWLSCKRQNKWEEVKEQAEQEDMSARDRLFQLAWLSLCERGNDFFNLLPSAVKAEDIDLQSLETFPIFEEFRQDKRYQLILNKLRRQKPKKTNSEKAKKEKNKKN